MPHECAPWVGEGPQPAVTLVCVWATALYILGSWGEGSNSPLWVSVMEILNGEQDEGPVCLHKTHVPIRCLCHSKDIVTR